MTYDPEFKSTVDEHGHHRATVKVWNQTLQRWEVVHAIRWSEAFRLRLHDVMSDERALAWALDDALSDLLHALVETEVPIKFAREWTKALRACDAFVNFVNAQDDNDDFSDEEVAAAVERNVKL